MAYTSWSVVFEEQPSVAKWNILGTNDAHFNDILALAGSYTSYAPTYTNVTVGDGTTVAKYCQIGKFIHYWGYFTMGSTSAMGSSPTISLPVNLDSTAVVASENFAYGTMKFQNTGVVTVFGYAHFDSATAISPAALNASGTYVGNSGLSSTVPFTWGVSDKMQWNVTYPGV